MKLSPDKMYTTRAGLLVRVLATNLAGKYPVAVAVLDKDGTEHVYTVTAEGKYLIDGLDLGAGSYDIVETPPYADFKIDEPVYVTNHPNAGWLPRHFAGVDEQGQALCWDDGKTSHTAYVGNTSAWTYCVREMPK